MTSFTPLYAIRRCCLVAVTAAVLATGGCLLPARVGTVDADATAAQKSKATPLRAALVTADGLVDLSQLPEEQSLAVRLPDPGPAIESTPLEPALIGAVEPMASLAEAPSNGNPPSPTLIGLGPPLYDGYSTKELFSFEALLRDELPKRHVELAAARPLAPYRANPEQAPNTAPTDSAKSLPVPLVAASPIVPLVTAQIQPVPPPAPLPAYQPVEQLPAMPPIAAPQAMPAAPLAAMPLAPSGTPGFAGEQSTDGQLSTVQRIKPIQQISLNIAPPPIFDDRRAPLPPPSNYAAEALPLLAQERPFTRGELLDYGYDLQPDMPALDFCYQPLYFEEVNVERYGRSFGVLQPAVSAAHFYININLLPIRLFTQPARRCTYHAHWALPGYRIPVKEH